MSIPKRRWFQIGLLILLMMMAVMAGASAGWVASKLRSGNPVKFVVPVGFHGTIQIIEDKARGQDLELLHGWYVFRIPPDGKLLVNDASIFNRWHEELCRDKEGHLIHLDNDPTYADGGAVHLSVQRAPR